MYILVLSETKKLVHLLAIVKHLYQDVRCNDKDCHILTYKEITLNQ